jgi:hypothetical protein
MTARPNLTPEPGVGAAEKSAVASINTVQFAQRHNVRALAIVGGNADADCDALAFNESVLDALDAQKAQAYEDLRAEFMQQFLRTGPRGSVRTPGYAQATWTVSALVGDYLCGQNADVEADLMLDIIARAAAGGDKQAMDWIGRAAHKHAEFHAEDLVRLQSGDEL